MAVAGIISVVSALIVFGAFFLLKSQIGGSSKAQSEALSAEIAEISSRTIQLLDGCESHVSAAQLAAIEKELEEIQTSISSQKSLLQEVDSKLNVAQKKIEEKEVHHQEMKTSKVEDEVKLAELMAAFATNSSESLGLEQRLAMSLKNIDEFLSTIELTPDQRNLLEDLSKALSSAGSRLRDLITEYETVRNRLATLQSQLQDLEDEYTRLVEQQLGA